MSKEVVKKTEYNKLQTKVYYLENSIPDATTLFDTTQINKIWRKKMEMSIKILVVNGLVTTIALRTKINEAEWKYQMLVV